MSYQTPQNQRRKFRKAKKGFPIPVIVALIMAAAGIITAIITTPRPGSSTVASGTNTTAAAPPSATPTAATPPAPLSAMPTPARTSAPPLPTPSVVDVQPDRLTGRLEGVVKDQKGNPISGLRVSFQHVNEPEVTTDQAGVFSFAKVPLGDQLLVIKPPAERGQLMQHIEVASKVNTVTVLYDAQSSKLALLSIVAPVSDSIVELRRNGDEYRSRVHGRCDGLRDILGQFYILVLVRSEKDARFWVQLPPAVVDSTSSTWQSDVRFGNSETPPSSGEYWYLLAVAAPSSSQLRGVKNLMFLTDLPPHIEGNVITVETKIKP